MTHKSKITPAGRPPHLYFVTALLSKTHTSDYTVNIDATCLISWCQWPISKHKSNRNA